MLAGKQAQFSDTKWAEDESPPNTEYEFTEETRPACQKLKYNERKFMNSTARMKRR